MIIEHKLVYSRKYIETETNENTQIKKYKLKHKKNLSAVTRKPPHTGHHYIFVAGKD